MREHPVGRKTKPKAAAPLANRPAVTTQAPPAPPTLAELTAALEEKDILLKEMHHRVKNNLLAVESLLKMRMRRLPEGSARDTMRQTAQRVNAVARAHEALSCTHPFTAIALRSYLQDVAQQVFEACQSSEAQIELKLAVDDIELGLDKAVKIGLLLSELLTNSLKHAFHGRQTGEVSIVLRRAGDGAHLVVADNGVGMPLRANPWSGSSLGLKLAASLARQIGSEIDVANDSGTRFEVRIPRL